MNLQKFNIISTKIFVINCVQNMLLDPLHCVASILQNAYIFVSFKRRLQHGGTQG